MPKISASTVADHRAAQRRALLDAARALLAENPTQRPGLGQVAAATGLSRSSVYHYFASSEDLLYAVVEDLCPPWLERVSAAVAGVDTVPGVVAAYVDANLELVAEGEHAILSALARLSPQTFQDERLTSMHEGLVQPLVQALRKHGAPEPERTAQLVNAVVYKATEMIESGSALASVQLALQAVLVQPTR
ncbi:TetR/AcrR family transcriptional regulator [Rhodococcus sp. X156]|uniref:TetR/AcrR family transcriptional regulator n=1 Tax=Rhodococcus sp. X156 TaxID=2499145 RepID=UPI000FD9C885|nr:TetR/AcrR family transcriptional regulator [Rhodococcus sp. X156]